METATWYAIGIPRSKKSVCPKEWPYLETMKLTPLIIKKAIRNLPEGQRLPKVERVYYSGPGYDETAIYYGHKDVYGDVIRFWLSNFAWVFFDEINLEWEYQDPLYLLGENIYPERYTSCLPLEDPAQRVKELLSGYSAILDLIGYADLHMGYDMSWEWCDKRLLFDYGDRFVLHNWYTGE
jgi:hypothetical protein